MSTIIVLFNLKEGVEVSTYENWAKSTDLPIVRGLDSIDTFSVLRSTGLLGSDNAPPYQYIEIININDMELFGADIGTQTMQRVAGEFQTFADGPLFISTASIE